jgi:hypothetical protein
VNRRKRSQLSYLESEDAVRQAVLDALPSPATYEDLATFARDAGLECSSLVEDMVTCSTPAPSGMPFARAKWLLTYRFRDGVLVDLSVSKGLIGP